MKGLVLAAAIAALPSSSLPHDWYPAGCCGGIDCQSLPRDAVRWTKDGWLILETGETIPERDARQSPDSMFHRCRTTATISNSKTRHGCFWAPGGGV
jgi:hypothetical protein